MCGYTSVPFTDVLLFYFIYLYILNIAYISHKYVCSAAYIFMSFMLTLQEMYTAVVVRTDCVCLLTIIINNTASES